MSFDCIAQSNGSRSRIHSARLWLGLVGWLDFFTFSAEAQTDAKACPECFVNHVRAEVCAIVNEPLSPPGASSQTKHVIAAARLTRSCRETKIELWNALSLKSLLLGTNDTSHQKNSSPCGERSFLCSAEQWLRPPARGCLHGLKGKNVDALWWLVENVLASWSFGTLCKLESEKEVTRRKQMGKWGDVSPLCV